MSTHTYDRKTYFGNWADAMQGDPSLMASIKAAFPGYAFVVRSHGAASNLVFEADLDAGQITTLDGIYAAWDPESTPPLAALPVNIDLATDKSTTSQNFIDLLSTTVNLNAASLTVYGEVSGECTVKTASLEFQVLVDDVAVKGFSLYAKGTSSVTHNIDVAAGVHSFKLQWRVTAGNGKVRASSDPLQHAYLRIS